MKSFTIENETNNIAVYATKRDAAAVANTQSFGTSEELADLAASWPGARLIKIWNSIPGNAPVAKFKDRATAVTRIWKAIQPLIETYDLADRASASVAAAAAPGAEPAQEPPAFEAEGTETVEEERQPEVPADAPEPNVGAQAPDVAPEAAPAKTKATRVKKTSTGATNAGAPREGSKTSQVIAMLKREGGTTLEEIMTAMGWQKHTTRAMLSAGGSLTKKHGLAVASEKVGDRRTYSIKA
jgi:hypothetical protein